MLASVQHLNPIPEIFPNSETVSEVFRFLVGLRSFEPSAGHDRGGYPSDLKDEQWTLMEPLLPPARVGPKGGRWEKHPRRRIVEWQRRDGEQGLGPAS